VIRNASERHATSFRVLIMAEAGNHSNSQSSSLDQTRWWKLHRSLISPSCWERVSLPFFKNLSQVTQSF